MRTIRNMRKFVSSEMILSLESRTADIANESSLDSVLNDMLLDQVAFRQGHLTLGAAIQNCTVESCFLSDLAGLKNIIKCLKLLLILIFSLSV